MKHLDDARIEEAGRRALLGQPLEDGTSVLASSKGHSMDVALIATDIDGEFRCRSIVSFRHDGELTLDSIHSDVAVTGDPETPLGPSRLAEDLAAFGPSHVFAIRHAPDVDSVLDDRGRVLAASSGTGFVVAVVDQPVPVTVRARLRDGSVGSPLVLGQ